MTQPSTPVGRRRFLSLAAAGGASVLLSTAAGARPAEAAVGTRTYVIVVDGCRPSEISTGLTPRLAALKKAGTDFPYARALPIAETIPNHVMMMTGVRPNRSGVPANSIYDRSARAIRTLDRPSDLRFATLLERLELKGRTTGTVLSKEYLYGIFGARATYRWEPSPLIPISGHASDSNTVDALIAMVRGVDPDVVFTNLGDVDRIGHVASDGVSRQIARATALINTDRQVGRFIDHLKATGKWTSSILMVLADHSMDWSDGDTVISVNSILASSAYLRGNIAIAQNGGADLIYWTGASSGRAAGISAIRSKVAAHRGVLAVYTPSQVRLGAEAGDLVAFCKPGWRFSDPTVSSNPIPGNHGHPATEPIPFFIGGGSPKVRRGLTLNDPVRTIDVAPTIGSFYSLGAPAGGYDGTARVGAFVR